MARAIDKDKLITSMAWHDQQGMISSIDDVLDIIEAFPTLTPPNEWVSVEERLPERYQNVLVCYKNGRVDIDWANSLGAFTLDNLCGRVTHWMPLPAPPDTPKEERNDNGR